MPDQPIINWMVVRDCSCRGSGQIESDAVPGAFYPCSTCNPNWCRLSFAPERTAQPPIHRNAINVF